MHSSECPYWKKKNLKSKTSLSHEGTRKRRENYTQSQLKEEADTDQSEIKNTENKTNKNNVNIHVTTNRNWLGGVNKIGKLLVRLSVEKYREDVNNQYQK